MESYDAQPATSRRPAGNGDGTAMSFLDLYPGDQIKRRRNSRTRARGCRGVGKLQRGMERAANENTTIRAFMIDPIGGSF
jgi:hypothetical protein